MPMKPSVLKKPRARTLDRPLGEPLYSAMCGGDPVDEGVGVGRMGSMHLSALAALNGTDTSFLAFGAKVQREASGGVSVSMHWPPGPDVHQVLSPGFVSPPPAGWWLDNGEPAPGTPGKPL